MSKVIIIAHQFFLSLCKFLNYIAVTVTFLMAVWIFADVIGRYFFNHPIGGTTELVKGMIIIIVFLSMPYTWQQNQHIRSTIFLNSLSPKGKLWLGIFISLIAIGVFALIFVYGLEQAMMSLSLMEFDGTELRVPVYPSRFIVVFVSGLMIIELLIEFFKDISFLSNDRGQRRA